MRIVIVGGGIVGQSLAEHLLKDRHELSLVERDGSLCEIIGEKLDLQIVCGSGSSPAVLRGAGLPDADMLLAVTPNNEVNIVACTIADQFDVTRRIARLRGREFLDSSALVDLQKLGITSVIHPEQVLVNHIMQYVESPHAVESANFEDGNILLRGYRIRDNMELAGKTPAQIRQHIDPFQVLFAAIIRNGVGMIPDGNMMIKGGDILYALLPRESLDRFLKMVGIERKPNRKIVITGDSYSTGELATALDATAHHVTLVDPSREHAEQMAAMLSKVVVLHGDCTQHDLLRELNIDKASFFISTSDGA
ncbi:MAG: NAD-binding protein, partial [Candidatus Zixiibacteriota bacterium]